MCLDLSHVTVFDQEYLFILVSSLDSKIIATSA